VAPSSGVPSGTASFFDGATLLGAPALNGSGQAELTTQLSAGSHTLTTVYNGDANFSSSTSAALSHSVAPEPSQNTAPRAPQPAPTAVLTRAEATAAAAPPASTPVPTLAPAPAAPPAPTVQAPAPEATTRFSTPLAPAGNGVIVQPVNPAAFLGLIPDGMRIEITAGDQALPADVNPAQLGSLGGGNAVRLAPPVDLQLVARDVATSAEVTLPNGALALTYVVSLPVLAQPTSPDETFTWLVAVEEAGHFLGYMRYPSTFDAHTNTLTFELTGERLQTISVLPVILQPSRVQTFLGDVHSWSSPFAGGVDFGVLGPVWDSYTVLAPQVGGRIGILSPDSSTMIWIDASGVGPAGNIMANQ
jgi:hypothetical protein